MMMKKVKFIYNPFSGNKMIINKLDIIIKKYQMKKYVIIPYRIDEETSIEEAFYDIEDGYDHILIAGGDGTVDIIINHMKENDICIPIAILPTGTANDFAKTLGMSENIEDTLDIILNSDIHKVDLGKINDKYFVNVASAGMFTDVSQRINNDFKNTIGKISYYIKGIEDALNLKKFNINIKSDDFEYNGDMYLILIFNGRTAGNINLAYKSELNDGLLDVIVFKAMPIPKTIPILLSIIRGGNIDYHEDIIYFKTKEIYIDCNDYISTDIDGEKGPDFPLHIKCEEESLQILKGKGDK